jgi:hypothetical protein
MPLFLLTTTINASEISSSSAGDYSKIAPELIAKWRVLLAEAMRAGYAVLAKGGASLDAVETTIRAMEDSGEFNCGRGAVQHEGAALRRRPRGRLDHPPGMGPGRQTDRCPVRRTPNQTGYPGSS